MRIVCLFVCFVVCLMSVETSNFIERRIEKIITAHRQTEGGGFVVRRPIGGRFRLDPFLMLDHMGPATYGPGEAVGAPDHPHRGFETITYILQGGIHHKDSAGNEGWIYFSS